jgi:hypothetical protein
MPPGGSTTYQLWVDPSAVTGGTFGFDYSIFGSGGVKMTAFTANAAALLTNNLNTTANSMLGNGGDTSNGNFTALELGTLTVSNTGPGDITLWTGDYVDSTFVTLVPATAPQILALVVPEPGTLVLLGVGVSGIAILVRRSRSRS